MGVGTPMRIVEALVERQARQLTIIGNDTARPGAGVGRLIEAGCVARAVVSHIGMNPKTQQKMMAGEIEQLRSAVWTGVTRDTRPTTAVSCRISRRRKTFMHRGWRPCGGDSQQACCGSLLSRDFPGVPQASTIEPIEMRLRLFYKGNGR
jgi:hypothetical protein